LLILFQLNRYSPLNDKDEDDDLERDVRKAQQDLDFEQTYINSERLRFERDNSIREQVCM